MGEKTELRPSVQTDKHILISPLDWGMGHATRCIPLIQRLLDRGAKVTLAATGRSELVLAQAFPQLELIDIPAYGITFSGKSVVLDISMQVPGMLKTIQDERLWLMELLENRKFHGVISDNRYGLDAHPRSVLITHQLMPLVPAAVNRWVKRKLNSIYKEFEAIWVPDVQGPRSLAGRLSHPESVPKHAQYVGLLSRFTSPAPQLTQDVDWLVILSGPEGQRKKSEDAVLERFEQEKGRVVILRGLPGSRTKLPSHIESVAHPPDAEFAQWVGRSKNLLATAGYSSIMDLVALQKGAWLMPTPGQFEQEYLADYLQAQGWFQQVKRKQLFRAKLGEVSANLPSFPQSFEWLDRWYDSL